MEISPPTLKQLAAKFVVLKELPTAQLPKTVKEDFQAFTYLPGNFAVIEASIKVLFLCKKEKIDVACRSLFYYKLPSLTYLNLRDTETSIKVVGLDGRKLTTAEIKEVGRLQVSTSSALKYLSSRKQVFFQST